jgi:hypothetical protein
VTKDTAKKSCGGGTGDTISLPPGSKKQPTQESLFWEQVSVPGAVTHRKKKSEFCGRMRKGVLPHELFQVWRNKHVINEKDVKYKEQMA